MFSFFFFNYTATTEIYTTDTLFPYTTLFRSEGDKQSAILRAEGDRQAAVLRAEGFSLALDRIFSIAKTVDSKTMALQRSEEHTSELQSLMRISYAVFCLKKKKKTIKKRTPKNEDNKKTYTINILKMRKQ